MNPFLALFTSSLGKKYLMALTGVILVLFVLGHMAGNLQIFLHPDAINAYAYKLHSLPAPVLWGIRLVLLVTVVIHIVVATQLTLENRRARPDAKVARVQATYASLTMRYSGYILAAFIVFHILHFTVRSFYGYADLPSYYLASVGKDVFDVHTMMIAGFAKWYVTLFYLLSMGLLCMHLTHGVSSMFQSIGLRNENWRGFLNKFATGYGWVVFLGFASIPLAVMLSVYSGFDLVHTETYLAYAELNEAAKAAAAATPLLP